jgi:hypothetical protein
MQVCFELAQTWWISFLEEKLLPLLLLLLLIVVIVLAKSDTSRFNQAFGVYNLLLKEVAMSLRLDRNQQK